jgi:Baseplate J-like protein
VPLPNPSLDDKTFAQIVDEARALIPRVAPGWTDHNVHDPGITFIELFAWLAEIQQYRLNRVAESSFVRFLRLAGLARLPQHPATARLTIAADAGLPTGVFVPSHSPVVPVGKEQFPFETLHDTFLTPSKLTAVRTIAGGREVDQTQANADPAAHFAPFGPSPALGDSVRFGFAPWFVEQEIHLHIELYEQGLPSRAPLPAEARGFLPSAAIRWQYLAADGWQDVPVIEDGTLAWSRTGLIRFKNPGRAAEVEKAFWIRATLDSGRYEIAPNIAEASTNSVSVRQVARIVNEDLGVGLGTADQVVRLEKSPLLIDEAIDAGPFDVGQVLDWQTTIMRLARPEDLHPADEVPGVRRVAEMLGAEAQQVLRQPELIDRSNPGFRPPNDEEERTLAKAFDALLDDEGFYDRRAFAGLQLPPEFRELTRYQHAFASRHQLRRFTRALLQLIFADQIVSDRLEVQVGIQARYPEEEPKSWTIWERRTDFSQSGPDDRHYVLHQETGEIRFGNGLNGRAPDTNERIRARLYFHSRGEEANLPAGQTWCFRAPSGALRARGINRASASGGAASEPLDEAALRARGEFRARSRAITADDYRELAKRTPGLRVAQVKVLPQFNPRLPCIRMAGHVTVVVLPYSPEGAVGPPQPSDGFLQTIANHLSAARLVTTVLHVIGPAFVPVEIRCTVFLTKGAKEDATRNRVEWALNTFLDPVRGGPTGNGWPIGRAVFPSEIHTLLMRDEAVEYVADVSLNQRPPEEPLPLGVTALPSAGRHSITMVTFEQRREGRANRPARGRHGESGHA